MATDNIIGIAMDLDVTDLKSGLQETKKAITTANKEFAAATSGMDDWTKTTEGLNAKLTQLDTVLTNQKKNVAGIEAELKKAKTQYGENSEQVRKLNDRLLDATAAVGKTEKAQRKYTQQLQDVESETKDANTATGKLDKSMKDAKGSAKGLGDGFTVLKGVMAGLVTKGITSLIGGLKDAISESREFRKEMAYLESGAESAGVSFEKAKENVKEVTAITEDQGAAIEGLNNLMTAGFDGDALDQITDHLVGASIKWKDTLKFEGLSDGLQETMATGKAVGPFVELLERGGLNAEEFDAGLAGMTTQAEKQNYILETLAGMGLADIKTGYEENNKTLIDGAKAELEYSEAMAQIGEKAEPVMTTIKLGFVDILNSFIEMSDGMDLEALKNGIKDAFAFFISDIVPIIKDTIKFVIDHWQILLAVIGTIGGAFAVWKVAEVLSGVVKGIKSVISALSMMDLSLAKSAAAWVMQKVAMVASTIATAAQTAAQWLLNVAMSANPIGIIIIAITALIAAFVLLWNKSETFRNFWIGLWEAIKKVAKVVIDWLVGAFKVAWELITIVWNAAVKFFTGIFDGIKNAFSSIGSTISGFFRDAWDRITGIWKAAGSWFSDVIDDIISFFAELPGKMLKIGEDMMRGLIDGVKNMIGAVADAVTDAVDSAIDGVKGFLGIHSPSTLMRDEIGEMMGEGIGVGILGSAKTVKKDIDKFNKVIKGQVDTISAGLKLDTGVSAPTSNSTIVNNNYSQVINAPKQPSRLELYRQTKNLLAYKGV